MLIKFRSPHAAEFLMFEDIARRLIKAMGCGDRIPGAILAADIPAALKRLHAALAAEATVQNAEPHKREDEDDPGVTLGQRASPLIAMLEAAQTHDSHVMWDS